VKMYILVKESLPLGNALVAVAHASLACYLRFRESPDVEAWLSGPFRKVVCRVNDDEFARAKAFDDHVVIAESSLDGAEVAIAFKPRATWDKAFQFFRLYR
jgi:peptidyl-tRNA hydrolase